MGYATSIEGGNVVLKAPKGDEETCNDLHVFRNRRMVVSCWQFEPAELEQIKRTGKVFLAVNGFTQPPVYLAGEDEMRAFTAEYGVLPKQTEKANG